MSPPEWEKKRGSVRPPEWHKTHGGPIRECEGNSSLYRAPTPPEWQTFPKGNKPRSDHHR